MRKINPHDFHVATRSTSRDINRRIALNLIREHQPISRADLARRMRVTRSIISVLVSELITEGLICEGATGETARGRKPTFLHVMTRDKLCVALDVRLSRTYMMLSDFSGHQLALEVSNTITDPSALVKDLSRRIRRMLKSHSATSQCEGIGVSVPGMVDHRTGYILNAPTLGWKQVDFGNELSQATGFPVHIENAAKACVLAQAWLSGGRASTANSFVHVSVSDGVGVGIVFNGELVRGHDNTAGEFGHVPMNLEGPKCMCGARGCWEAYVSNIATLSRYFGRDLSKVPQKPFVGANGYPFTVDDLVARAHSGDDKAVSAVNTTAEYLGLGLATVINALNPDCVFIGGEITTAWDLIESVVRSSLAERTLTEAAARTPIHIAAAAERPRLRGAAALVAAPTFAAPRVA
jgi:predicted NBD/HSP70 family sugar kinase